MRIPLRLDKPMPAVMRSMAIDVLLGLFARVFDVKPPRVALWPAQQALDAFRSFSAACMEEALASPAYATACRAELERRATRLGGAVRAVLAPRNDELMPLVSWMYEAIGIEVAGTLYGTMLFRRCAFSERYAPALCAFMSAFDSGFVGGLCGGGSLRFERRITEGHPCCCAQLALYNAGYAHAQRGKTGKGGLR